MANTINKIYARANAAGIVTYIFSQAFDTPLETDVCIDETNTDRHGAQRYPVLDENGIFNYEIKGGIFKERDKTAELAKLEADKLDPQYIPSETASLSAFAKAYIKENPLQSVSMKLAVSGLYDTWVLGKYEVGDIRNHAGQTWECHQAHDNAVYPDINPDNAQTWATFWKPLHGDTKETARPWTKPWAGTTDMYHAGEFMIYTDGNIYKCLSDTVYSPEEYAAHWQIQK